MLHHVKQFANWVAGSYHSADLAELEETSHAIHDTISQALADARRNAAADGRSPTLVDYITAAERLDLTPQQMADLSTQDVSGFILARAHLEDCRLPYLRSHGITVRGAKLDRCRMVPMTVIELMAMDPTTSMREVEFVAG